MNADLEHLIILQAQDLELRRLRAQLADAPVQVAAAQTARAHAEVALAEATKSLAKEETLRRSLELEVKDRHGKISRPRKQMEPPTSPAQNTPPPPPPPPRPAEHPPPKTASIAFIETERAATRPLIESPSTGEARLSTYD